MRGLIIYTIGFGFGTLFGAAMGPELSDWKRAAKRMFKRTPKPKQMSFEDMMDRPKFASFLRDLNRREPK